VRYPYLSLTELALVAEPPLSRSAVNRRLRRLTALAAELEG
jgi:DNA-binding transcriptional regulator WhiA